VLDGAESYDWFRGRLPIGISRVTSGMTAFALRHERLYDGRPTIVVNGHVPGLAELFDPTAWVFDLGIDGDRTTISEVRRILAGADSLPGKCAPGSLRRDGADGHLPLSGPAVVDSRYNLVHCSDGLVAGFLEVRALLPDRIGTDLLTDGLIGAGLTRPEIDGIVGVDPRIPAGEPNGYLTDATRGLDLTAAVAAVARLVPPVLGGANGYADGVDLATLDRALTYGMTQEGELPSPAGALPRTRQVTAGDAEEAAGSAALRADIVGTLIPAGGTGGRFDGYGVPETDPSRQKALAPVFRVGGRRVSALDIRLANLRYWGDGVGDRVPVAVMGSPTSAAALREWRRSLSDPYAKSLQMFLQHGIYRLDRALIPGSPRGLWADAILRDADNRPSQKPHGGMGLFTAFVISGLLDTWERSGVAYVAVANGDDVLFRLDPRAMGHLAGNPEVDAVIVAVPWGFAATVRDTGGSREVRADESGWSMDENGTALAEPVPVPDRRYDRGGAITIARGHLSIADGSRKPGALFHTNQLYLRLSAIRRLLGGSPLASAGSRAEAVARLISRLPAALEDKTVLIDGVPRPARQLSQPLHGLLRLLDRCDVITASRGGGPGAHGGYGPLKHPGRTGPGLTQSQESNTA
jgi:hypothetical protein